MEDKCEKDVFLERSNRGHQMFFGVLSIMSCTTAVCMIFLVSCVRPLVGHVRQNIQPCEHNFFRVLTF